MSKKGYYLGGHTVISRSHRDFNISLSMAKKRYERRKAKEQALFDLELENRIREREELAKLNKPRTLGE